MTYPLSYQPQYVEQRSRLTTFFRLLLAIPVVIVSGFWALVGSFTVVAAWFALLVTARYPPSLYQFNAGVARAVSRCTSYLYLLADPFPPLGLDEHPEYPIRLLVAPPQASYSRLKVLFRAILWIPVAIVTYVFHYAAVAVAVISWFVIVAVGRMPGGLHNALAFLLGFNLRAYGYLALMTDTYPPFSDPGVRPPTPQWSAS